MEPLTPAPGSAAALTLLFVEDDASTRAVFLYAAERSPLPVRVQAVSNGVEALRYLQGAGPYANREQYPLPDVMLLDIAMPEMNGFEVLRTLRTSSPPGALPVVVLSGVSYPGWKETALELGAVKFLEKGARLEDWLALIAEVATCVRERPAVPPSASVDVGALPPPGGPPQPPPSPGA